MIGHDTFPTQTAPRCEHGQAATGLPPAPSLLPSISISLKPSNLHSPMVLLPLSLRELQASPGDTALRPLPLPALSFLSSKFLFISRLLASRGYCSHLSSPQSLAAALGSALHPARRWGAGADVVPSQGGANASTGSAQSPPESHELPTKPANRVTKELRGMRCVSASVKAHT